MKYILEYFYDCEERYENFIFDVDSTFRMLSSSTKISWPLLANYEKMKPLEAFWREMDKIRTAHTKSSVILTIQRFARGYNTIKFNIQGIYNVNLKALRK